MAARKNEKPAAKPDGRRKALFAGAAALALVFAGTRLMGGGGEDPFDKLGDTTAQAGTVTGSKDHGDHSSGPAEVEAPDQPIRDPFCPQVVPPGSPPPNCGTRLRHVAVDALKLVEVFVEDKMPHARVQVGAETKVLHVHEGLGGYTADSLDGATKCGQFSRQGETRAVCAGEEWSGTA